jgi:hypothetical protein
MSARLLSLVVTLAVAATARAQTYNLAEPPALGSYHRLELKMDLAGEIKVRQSGKEVVLKHTAQAAHEYLERVLNVSSLGLPDKGARFYKLAQAWFGADERRLRGERALMVAHRVNEHMVSYALKGLLTREEFELTEHFDTLALPALLPGKEIAVGGTWPLSNAAVQAACDLDGLTGHDLVGKLDKVQGDVASIVISGTASGIDLGAAVKLKVNARLRFDLKAQRIVAMEWKQHDERERGPVSPAMRLDVVTTMQRTSIPPATEVDDFSLFSMSPAKTPPEEVTQISYVDPNGRFELSYNRDWHLVGRTDDHLVLRLLDRGDFVAQVTITAWKKASPGKHITPEDFAEAMARTPGWSQGKVVEQAEVKSTGANWIYRIAATGTFDGDEAVQYFYVVAGPQGDQTVLTFTMTPRQAQKLESRDLALVRSLTYAGDSNRPSVK